MHPYTQGIIDLLSGHADREKAVPMKAYMKGVSEYLGIPSPERKELLRQFTKTHGWPAPDTLDQIIPELWKQPFREYQYVGVDLLMRLAKKLTVEQIALIEYTLTMKSWWDTVDMLAANVAAPFFTQYPDLERSKPDEWIATDNMWLQRTAILYQLKSKDETDADRLFSYCRHMADSQEFFIRKAIGWALREYSKIDADAVRQFVANTNLHSLSQREALKWLDKKERK